MDLDTLITRLTELRATVGGTARVLVVDGEGEYTPTVHAEDGDVLLDLT